MIYSPDPVRGLEINLGTEELQKEGCTVISASGDADVDIVKVAIEVSQHQNEPVNARFVQPDNFHMSTLLLKMSNHKSN